MRLYGYLPDDHALVTDWQQQQQPATTTPAPAKPPSLEDLGATPAQGLEDLGGVLEKPAEPASATERFLSGAWSNLNPIAAAEFLGNVFAHPVETGKNVVEPSVAQLQRAKDAFTSGRPDLALGHMAAAVPILGPAVAHAVERVQSGDVAGGAGELTGLVAPAVVAPGSRGLVKAVRQVPGVAESVAASAERVAGSQLGDVMTPKVGANKLRFGNTAAKIAPALAKEEGMGAWTRQGFAAKVAGKLDEAEAALDAAAAARNPTATFPTAPILDDLRKQRARLVAEGVPQQGAIGSAKVEPAPNRARLATIDQAIKEVSGLGAQATYEALRRIRQAYDGPAKAVYSPSMTADYLAKSGEKLGAADVTGTLREHLAQMDPAAAEANAQYHLFRSAHDALQAVEETERARPKVGRRIMAGIAGTTIGGAEGGAIGAGIGAILGPVIDYGLSAGPTVKVQLARGLSQVADALRGGHTARAESLMRFWIKKATSAAVRSGGNLTGGTPLQVEPSGGY